MNKWQKDVLNFHNKFGGKVEDIPTAPNSEIQALRLNLIQEELDELEEAFLDKNVVEIADSLADLMYVVLGTAVSCGIDLEPVWDEVHKTNMAKEGGSKRSDGKILKPEGWKPPDLVPILEKQGWQK